MGSKPILANRAALDEICRRHGVAKLEIFGSFASGDAGPESDLDILVTFETSSNSLFDIIDLEEELVSLFGRPVDLLTRASVEQSRNKYFKYYALQHTEPLYE